MGHAMFIVWSESVEALLVIGVLWAWLNYAGTALSGRGEVKTFPLCTLCVSAVRSSG